MAADMDVDTKTKKRSQKHDESDSDSEDEAQSDTEMLDVDFEFFDPTPIDFHSIKLLLSQLLSHDSPTLDLGGIADLIIAKGIDVGSVVKTDGKDSDPYAVLSLLNVGANNNNEPFLALTNYLLSRVASTELHPILSNLFSPPASSSTALILSERLVNMPAQITPPMYRLLFEELNWLKSSENKDDEKKKEYSQFEKVVVLSRVFYSSKEEMERDPNAAIMAREDEDMNGAGGGGGGKKKKGGKKRKSEHESAVESEKELVWWYHPEDELLAKAAIQTHHFAYASAPTRETDREADAFGVKTKGCLIVLEWKDFEKLTKEGGELEGYLS